MGKLAVKKPDHVEGKTWPAIAIGMFVAFGGVLFGYDTGTISGILAMPYWQNLFSTGYRDSTNHLNVSPSQSSAIVSILSAGTFFGALASPLFADSIGRRYGLITSTLVFTFGVILQTAAVAVPLFLAGRFFAGLGVGLLSAISMLSFFQLFPSTLFCRSETRLTKNLAQFLSTSPKPPRNGSAAPSLAPTSSPSPLACSSPLLSTTPPNLARTRDATEFPSLFSSPGQSFSLAA